MASRTPKESKDEFDLGVEENNFKSKSDKIIDETKSVVKEETESEKRLRRKNETIISIKSQFEKMEIGEKLSEIKFEGNVVDVNGKDYASYMYNLNFYTQKDCDDILGTYITGGASDDKKVSEIFIGDDNLSLNILDKNQGLFINAFLNYYMKTHAKL